MDNKKSIVYCIDGSNYYNKAVVISGFSGVGKSTVIAEVEKKLKFVKKSISVTTRVRRVGEIDGKNYYFVTYKKFMQFLSKRQIIEWTQVLDNFYGTLRQELESIWRKKKLPLLDIDYYGVENLQKLSIKLLKIYLLPPTFSDLVKRMMNRGISQTEYAKRLYFICDELNLIFNINSDPTNVANVNFEKIFTTKYDFIIVNSDFEKTVKNICLILRSYKWT